MALCTYQLQGNRRQPPETTNLIKFFSLHLYSALFKVFFTFYKLLNFGFTDTTQNKFSLTLVAFIKLLQTVLFYLYAVIRIVMKNMFF